ncbi:MAG: GtrA family protein [Microbacteriaceae bacterium]|nr:GtrA family protein [Microbacteriaceae bacterium]MCL2794270.1 GtrA family protein [Microbacteriaceae bacterium]
MILFRISEFRTHDLSVQSFRWGSVPILGQLVRFGAVGAASFGIDVAVFNLLRIAHLPVLSEPLTAKTVGVVVATVFAWLGSRYFTFGGGRRPDAGHEFAEFAGVSALGYAVNLFVLFCSHYMLGFTSLLADNIAGNLIGAALGTVIRFWLFRSWVYHPRRSAAHRERVAAISK